MRQNRFYVSTGAIEVNYPMPMTTDDVQDFKDQMAITFRILERTATNEQRQKGEATSAANISELTPNSTTIAAFEELESGAISNGTREGAT